MTNSERDGAASSNSNVFEMSFTLSGLEVHDQAIITLSSSNDIKVMPARTSNMDGLFFWSGMALEHGSRFIESLFVRQNIKTIHLSLLACIVKLSEFFHKCLRASLLFF